MRKLFYPNTAILADKIKLRFVDKRIIYIGNKLILERNLAVKLVVGFRDITNKLLLVVELFKTFQAELRVGIGAVELSLTAFYTEHFGAVEKSELGGGIMNVEHILTVFLQIAIAL